MSQVFVQGAQRKSFDGMVLLMLDDAADSNTVYELPAESIVFNTGENNDYPILIDDNGININKVPGAHLGAFQATGFWKNDHFTTAAGKDFLTQAFGPRSSGQLNPWILALVPYSGGTPIYATGVWMRNFALSGRFGTDGRTLGIQWQLSALIADPSNYYGAIAGIAVGSGNFAVPGYAGTPGAGISTFGNCSFDSGAPTTPTIYDSIRAFSMMLDNGLDVIPAFKNTSLRLVQGFVPSPISGRLTLTQLLGCTNAIPGAGATAPDSTVPGNYPLDILIPDGSGSKTYLSALSISYDADAYNQAARDFSANTLSYTLFTTQSGNDTGTASTPWPFVNSYATSPT